MKMQMKITFNDGSVKDATVVFADFVAFERTWNRSIAGFATDIRLTDIGWLAWRSEIRNKNTSAQFDPEWLNTVDNVELVDDDEVEDSAPLDKAAQ
jgi:hypothetical protein